MNQNNRNSYDNKVDIMSNLMSHLSRESNTHSSQIQRLECRLTNFQNQFDTYTDVINRKFENQTCAITTSVQNQMETLFNKLQRSNNPQPNTFGNDSYQPQATYRDHRDQNYSQNHHVVTAEVHNEPRYDQNRYESVDYTQHEDTYRPRHSDSYNRHNQLSENIAYTRPNSYNGKSSWSDYKVHFETVATLNQWSSKTKALQLIACMQEAALATIGDINTNNPPTYEDLVDKLNKRFAPKNQIDIYRNQLDTRIRKRGESLPELAQDIKRLVRLSYPDIPQHVQDNLAYKSFREAITDYELGVAITHSNTDTIDDALNSALKHEAFQMSHRRPSLRQVSGEPNRPPVKNDNHGDEKPKFKNPQSGLCFYCGKPGHVQRHCRKRQSDNNNQLEQIRGGKFFTDRNSDMTTNNQTRNQGNY